MRIIILLGLLCSALLVGCGNRVKPADVEAKSTKVDVEVPAEFAKAKAELAEWEAEFAKAKEELAKAKLTKAELTEWEEELEKAKAELAELEEEFAKEKAEVVAKALAVQSAIDRQYGGEARCPKCPKDWDIDRIELETTSFDGIWRAKIYVNCHRHGYQLSEVSEWQVSDDSVERVRVVK